MTTYKPPPLELEPPRPRHDVALWAGVAAFFGSLLAIGLFDVFDVDQWAEYLGALIVAAITAGAVYARERLADAKRDRTPARLRDERGQVQPLQLLVYVIVVVILIVVLFAVIDRLE